MKRVCSHFAGKKMKMSIGGVKKFVFGAECETSQGRLPVFLPSGKWAKWPACVFSFLREYFSAPREVPVLNPPGKPVLLISSLPYRLGANSQGL